MTTGPYTLHHLLHSADLVEDALRQRLARIDMRPRQARIIDALARMEPASQVALARAFDITPASMSTMTARLIEAGFVTREVDPEEARATCCGSRRADAGCCRRSTRPGTTSTG